MLESPSFASAGALMDRVVCACASPAANPRNSGRQSRAGSRPRHGLRAAARKPATARAGEGSKLLEEEAGRRVSERRPVDAEDSGREAECLRRRHEDAGSAIAIRRSGDPAIRRSGDPAIRRSGDPAIRRSGDPAIRRSGDPAIRRSGDPAIRRSGDPAIRRSGDPALYQGESPQPLSSPKSPDRQAGPRARRIPPCRSCRKWRSCRGPDPRCPTPTPAIAPSSDRRSRCRSWSPPELSRGAVHTRASIPSPSCG